MVNSVHSAQVCPCNVWYDLKGRPTRLRGFKEQVYDIYRYLPPSTQVKGGEGGGIPFWDHGIHAHSKVGEVNLDGVTTASSTSEECIWCVSFLIGSVLWDVLILYDVIHYSVILFWFSHVFSLHKNMSAACCSCMALCRWFWFQRPCRCLDHPGGWVNFTTSFLHHDTPCNIDQGMCWVYQDISGISYHIYM